MAAQNRRCEYQLPKHAMLTIQNQDHPDLNLP